DAPVPPLAAPRRGRRGTRRDSRAGPRSGGNPRPSPDVVARLERRAGRGQRQVERRLDRGPHLLDRPQRRRHPDRPPRRRPGRHQLPHLRAGPLRRPDPGCRRPGRRQRPGVGAADDGAGRSEPEGGRRDRRPRRPDDRPRGVGLRLLVPRVRRRPQPPPLDQRPLRDALRRDRRRRALRPRPGQRGLPPGEPGSLPGRPRGVGRGDPGGGPDHPRAQPAAPHLPRLLGLLRAPRRDRGDRRRPAVRLLGALAAGGGSADRPDPGGARAGRLRLRGLPQRRPGANRRGGRGDLRRPVARRRPARRTERARAHLRRDDAAQHGADDPGPRRLGRGTGRDRTVRHLPAV
ncbi:MAG: Zinc ABC transporter, periplasmic-binding protein ZnuA, partial [uncultured Thermomicrobiales bacterium]